MVATLLILCCLVSSVLCYSYLAKTMPVVCFVANDVELQLTLSNFSVSQTYSYIGATATPCSAVAFGTWVS